MLSDNFICISLIVCAILLCNNYADGAMTREQMESAAKGMRNVCIGKTGADPALVLGMKNGEFPADPNLQCYAKCIMSTLKMMKNGQPLLDNMLKQIRIMMPADIQERTTAVARYCAAIDLSADPCVAAWEMVKCQYAQDSEVFFFP